MYECTYCAFVFGLYMCAVCILKENETLIFSVIVLIKS